ncbi:hypothetical protein ACE1B6_10710 [Aerosakkonemataceae cyanobacterium BLCC-F154]|uniref:Uncharacterized protein n=1 Tax=Floridaenema fluviatile BLCC-F154 TaxID=3153640 RepID=A0ABV4YBU1_9CYAN
MVLPFGDKLGDRLFLNQLIFRVLHKINVNYKAWVKLSGMSKYQIYAEMHQS